MGSTQSSHGALRTPDVRQPGSSSSSSSLHSAEDACHRCWFGRAMRAGEDCGWSTWVLDGRSADKKALVAYRTLAVPTYFLCPLVLQYLAVEA